MGYSELVMGYPQINEIIPGLVNVQKAIENGHRNSEFPHKKW
jgi:hypothetical protein